MSSSKDQTDNVFTQLRRLCKTVEKGVQELQTDYDQKNSSTDQSPALSKLNDYKQHVQQIKRELQEKTDHLRETDQAFDEFVELCTAVVTNHNNKLNQIENHLQQYGYTKKVPTAITASETKTEEEEALAEPGELSTPSPQSKTENATTVCKTPRLEDFGMSQYALRFMNKGPKENVYDTRTPHKSYDMMDDTVPSIFHHDGLEVTPSVMGKCKLPYQTPDIHYQGKFMYGSPFVTPLQQSAARSGFNGNMPKLNLDVRKTPPSPKIITPSMKRLQQKHRAQKPNEKFNMNACTTDRPDTSESLHTPKSPELTVNFKALKDITGTLKWNSHEQLTEVKTSEKEPSKYSTSETPKLQYRTGELEMPESPEMTYNFQAFQGALPRMPSALETLTDKLGQNSKVTPEMPELLTQYKSDSRGRGIVDTGVRKCEDSVPESPKFLGEYRFTNKCIPQKLQHQYH